jgi:hypothetical protein
MPCRAMFEIKYVKMKNPNAPEQARPDLLKG